MKLFTAAFALLFVPLLANCDNAGTTSPSTDRITIVADVNSVSLMPGGTSAVAITITRPNGYVGPITLTAENLPRGVTGIFSPSSLEPAASTSTLTLTADAGTTTSTGAVTVRASGTNVQSQTTMIAVVIGNGGGATGSFTMLLAPSVVTVARGGTTSALVSINRAGNFAGAVNLAVSGFPAGVFATVSPGTVSAGSATVSITIDASVLSGSYTGTVSGQADGAPPQSAQLTVTVTTSLRQ